MHPRELKIGMIGRGDGGTILCKITENEVVSLGNAGTGSVFYAGDHYSENYSEIQFEELNSVGQRIYHSYFPPNPITTECTCEGYTLFNFGCRCGWKERNDSEKSKSS